MPWIEFLIKEGTQNKHFPVIDGQVIEHWIGAIKDEDEKLAMVRKYAKELQYKRSTQREEEMDDSYDMWNKQQFSSQYPSADFNTWMP